jgi:hypothetical protein
LHQIDIEIVENFRVLAQGIRESGATLDISLDLQNGLGKRLVLGLLAQDVQALDEREAGIDHCRELTREEDKILLSDLAAEPRERQFLGFGFDGGDNDMLLAQGGNSGFSAVGLDLALMDSPSTGAPFPQKGVCAHGVNPLSADLDLSM